MFDAKLFSNLVQKSQGKRSLNEYARNTEVSASYLSRIKNMQIDKAPSPLIIRKLADRPEEVSYTELMAAAGHILPMEEAEKRKAKFYYINKSFGNPHGTFPVTDEDIAVLTQEERDELDNFIEDSTEEELWDFLSSLSNIDDATLMIRAEEELQALDNGMLRIPVLGKISCGDPILSEENFQGFRYEHVSNLPKGELFILEAKGNSMEPSIPNGSFVTIRVQPGVENGEIAAVRIDNSDEATLKRVKKQGSVILLMPDNKDYDPIIVTEDTPITILGKAMRYSVDL